MSGVIAYKFRFGRGLAIILVRLEDVHESCVRCLYHPISLNATSIICQALTESEPTMNALDLSTGCGMLNTLTSKLASRLSIASFIGSMQLSGLLTALIIVRLFQTGPKDTLFVCLISTFSFLVLAPLAWTDSRWIHDLVAFACASSETYFPTTVVVEDEAAFTPDSAYILGLSPHSAMPTALPVVFSSYSKQLPPGERL